MPRPPKCAYMLPHVAVAYMQLWLVSVSHTSKYWIRSMDVYVAYATHKLTNYRPTVKL